MTCSCGEVLVGGQRTGSHNWEPDCEEHGVRSKWYAEIGLAKFKEHSDRAIGLQAIARARRHGTAVPCEPCDECYHTGWTTPDEEDTP